jgi:hypothetical protein
MRQTVLGVPTLSRALPAKRDVMRQAGIGRKRAATTEPPARRADATRPPPAKRALL